MSATAIRNIAYASALATGLLFGGIGAGTAFADHGDTSGGDDGPATADVETPSGSGGPDGASDVGRSPVGAVSIGGVTVGGSSEGSGSDNDRPTSTIGNGRNDVVYPNETPGANRPVSVVRSPRKFAPSVRIPVLRLPTAEEFRAPGPTPPRAYFGTTKISIPTLADLLRALSQPEPAPAPGPAFRSKEEAPVIDVAGNGGGDGSDRSAAAAAPPVFQAPVVVAPRPPAGAGARSAPSGPAAAPPNPPTAAPQPAVAGARTPAIRGTLPPSGTIPVTRPLAPATGQTAPAGYPRYLRATAGELAIVALPGGAGLVFLTAGGGVIGYRQANSSRYVRSTSVARFLP